MKNVLSGVQRCSAHLATAPELQVEVVKARRSGGVAAGVSALCFLCAGKQVSKRWRDSHLPITRRYASSPFIYSSAHLHYSLCALLIVQCCEYFTISLTGKQQKRFFTSLSKKLLVLSSLLIIVAK